MSDDAELAAIRARDAAWTPRSHAGADVVGDRHTLLCRLDEALKHTKAARLARDAFESDVDKLTAERDALAAKLTDYDRQLNQAADELALLTTTKNVVEARVQALEAALRDIEYNANYNGLRHIWEMARAALKPTQSQTEVAPP